MLILFIIHSSLFLYSILQFLMYGHTGLVTFPESKAFFPRRETVSIALASLREIPSEDFIFLRATSPLLSY